MKKSIISSNYVGLSILFLLVGGLILFGMPGNAPAPTCGDGYADTAAEEECDDGNNIDGDGCSADCRLEEDSPQECWLTVGGVKFVPLAEGMMAEHGPKDSFGGNVYPGCNSDTGAEGGSLTHIFHSEKVHFHGTDITVDECGNVPGIDPGSESPVTPFNYIMFSGTGTIAGIKGNKLEKTDVCFDAEFQDRNEPGNERALSSDGGADVDRYRLRVFDCISDETLLLIGDFDNLITLTGGNAQLHISSCDN